MKPSRMKLSPAMKDAVTVARERGGGELVRWRGGFWTFAAAREVSTVPDGQGRATPVPEWHVGGRTIDGLIQRGAAEAVEFLPWAKDRPAKVRILPDAAPAPGSAA